MLLTFSTCHHQKTPFSAQKEIRRGKIKNNSKGFSGGASGRFTPAGVGTELQGLSRK